MNTMNEQDIGRMVEWSFDNLDRRYMRGQVSNEDYDREATAIEAWAKSQLSCTTGGRLPALPIGN